MLELSIRAGELRELHLIEPGRFVQENQSRSRHRTIRGLSRRQALGERKILRVARGDVFAVVDLRPWSTTFGPGS